jgi:hypothetical protein
VDTRTITNVKEIKEFIESYNGTRKGLSVNSKDLDALVNAIPNIRDLVDLTTVDFLREGVCRLQSIGNLNYPIGIIFLKYEDEREDNLTSKWYNSAWHGWNICMLEEEVEYDR